MNLIATALCAVITTLGEVQNREIEAAQRASIETALASAEAFLAVNQGAVLDELQQFLTIPNSAANPDDIRQNADTLVQMLARRGARTEILETPGAPPAVFAELLTPGASKTILFYAHFDGQPVGDASEWETPPFEPHLKLPGRNGKFDPQAISEAEFPLPDNARIYARSASDDKGPIIAILTAIDALNAAQVEPSVNIKFFLDGEEEAGSPNLARTIRRHGEKLRSDLWIFADGPGDPEHRQRVVLGVRGVAIFQITVYGPAIPLHSGHYGNVAPNPAARLARLIASMRGENGEILVRGFRDLERDISPTIRGLSRTAFADAMLLAGPQLIETESGFSYGESVLTSALNITQLTYGGEGAARNAIDTEASADFDLRLAPGVSVDAARHLIARHLSEQGYHLVRGRPSKRDRAKFRKLASLQWDEKLGYSAAAARIDDPTIRRVIGTMREAAGADLRVIPMLGGSLPITPIMDILNASFIIVPIVNPDNNQHTANENLRWGDFRRGVGLFATIISDSGK